MIDRLLTFKEITMRRILFIALMFILFKATILYALSVESHMAINTYISKNDMNGLFSLDSYLKNTLGFKNGINEEIYNSQVAWEWLREGGGVNP